MLAEKKAVIYRFFFFLFTLYTETSTAQNRFFPLFFVNEINIPSGSSRFTIGDFNNDGFPDLVVVSREAITCLKNEQNSKFSSYSTIYLREAPADVKICELDGDGASEIVAVYKSTARVEVFKNDTSSFKKFTSFEAGIYPEMLICYDIDLNGLKDVVTVGKTMLGISVNYQTEPRQFSRPVNFFPEMPLRGVQLIDLNYDEVPDLVGIDWVNNLLVVSYGRGDGKFGRSYTYQLPEEPTDFKVVDLNNDGFFDYVISFYYLDEIQFFYTTQAGITPRFKFKVPKPTNVCVGDINGDGLSDIVVNGERIFSIFINSGTNFKRYDFSSEALSQIECFDVDRNSKDDIVALDSIKNKLIVFYSEGKFDVSENFSIAVGLNSSDFVVADFDRDGYIDIALACKDSSLLLIYSGEKFSILSYKIEKTFTDLKFLSVLDFNYLICTNYETGDASIFRFKGKAKPNEVFRYNFDKPSPIFVGLRQDKLVSFFLLLSDSNLVILKPKGETSLDEFTIKDIDSTKVVASAVGDFNVDGYLDVAIVNQDTSGVRLNIFLRMEGEKYVRSYSLNLNRLIKRAFLFADDFTGDGSIDILLYYDYSTDKISDGEISLLINDGTGKFKSRRRVSTHVYLSNRKLLKSADITGDLQKDFVVFDKSRNRLYLYVNKNGIFEKKEIGMFRGIDSLGIGDINRDGLPDIFLLNGESGIISFLINKDGAFK